MKKARVKIENRKGRHPQGGPQTADMVLRSGARGTGRVIQRVHVWPWSEKSVEVADEIIAQAAKRAAVEIAPEEED